MSTIVVFVLIDDASSWGSTAQGRQCHQIPSPVFAPKQHGGPGKFPCTSVLGGLKAAGHRRGSMRQYPKGAGAGASANQPQQGSGVPLWHAGLCDFLSPCGHPHLGQGGAPRLPRRQTRAVLTWRLQGRAHHLSRQTCTPDSRALRFIASCLKQQRHVGRTQCVCTVPAYLRNAWARQNACPMHAAASGELC